MLREAKLGDEELLKRKYISWCQLSKHKWIKDGYRSVRFFHILANAMRIQDHILRIIVNEVIKSEEID